MTISNFDKGLDLNNVVSVTTYVGTIITNNNYGIYGEIAHGYDYEVFQNFRIENTTIIGNTTSDFYLDNNFYASADHAQKSQTYITGSTTIGTLTLDSDAGLRGDSDGWDRKILVDVSKLTTGSVGIEVTDDNMDQIQGVTVTEPGNYNIYKSTSQNKLIAVTAEDCKCPNCSMVHEGAHKLAADWVQVTDGSTVQFENGGCYMLRESDVTANLSMKPGATATFCLGYFDCTSELVVPEGATLNLYATKEGADFRGRIQVYGTLNMYKLASVAHCTTENGAVYINGGMVNMYNDASIKNNSTTGSGGSVYMENGATLNMYHASKISENTTTASNGEGGGIYAKDSTINMDDSAQVSNNTTKYDGGGIKLDSSTLTMKSFSYVYKNTSTSGGGIDAEDSTINMEGSSFVFLNESKSYGGGIYAYDSAVNMKGSSYIKENKASNGGGMYLYTGDLNMYDNASVYSNTATRDGNNTGFGGGLYLSTSSKAYLYDKSSIYKNTAEYAGGGVYLASKSFYMYDNARIYENSATRGIMDYWHGDGIYVASRTPQLQLRGNAEITANGRITVAVTVFSSITKMPTTKHSSILLINLLEA